MITKDTITNAIVEKLPKISIREAQHVAEHVISSLAARLAKGERLQLRGLMTGRLIHMRGKLGRNPKTGEAVQIPPRVKMKLTCTVPLDADVELS